MRTTNPVSVDHGKMEKESRLRRTRVKRRDTPFDLFKALRIANVSIGDTMPPLIILRLTRGDRLDSQLPSPSEYVKPHRSPDAG